MFFVYRVPVQVFKNNRNYRRGGAGFFPARKVRDTAFLPYSNAVQKTPL